MFGSKWQLECCPNGYTSESVDHISLFLKCNTVANKTYSCAINFQFNFVEANEIKDLAGSFVLYTNLGISKAMKRDPNLNKLTIKVKMENTGFMSDEWMVWRIKGYLLDEFKSCKVKKQYYSPTISMSGMKWKLKCYPNGWFEEGLVDIDIIPHNVSEILDIS
eukprot:388825_1